MKIKIIRADKCTILEERVNKWLEQHSSFEIYNIRITSCAWGTGRNFGESFVCMLVYDEVPEILDENIIFKDPIIIREDKE